MSRASDLRDAVVGVLAAALPGTVRVRSVVTPAPRPEQLDDGPILAVRVATRNIEVDMSHDTREVVIWCALFGMVPESEDFELTEEQALQRELEETDKLDDILEQAMDLWTPKSGPARRKYLAEHRFNGITQPQALDADLWVDFGIWGGPFFLTFIDDRDE